MNDSKLREINWVRERSQCSTAHKFQILKSEIKGDVEERNRLDGERFQPRFAFDASNGDVVVTRSDANRGVSVSLTVVQNAIVVLDDSRREMFKVSVTLNDEGECVFRIGDQECASWHVRKRALEALFF